MVVGDTLNLSVNGQTGSLTRISGVSGSVFGEWNGGSRSENGITYKVSLIIAPASVTNKGTCTSANAEATATATSIAAITSTQIDIKETKSSTATN